MPTWKFQGMEIPPSSALGCDIPSSMAGLFGEILPWEGDLGLRFPNLKILLSLFGIRGADETDDGETGEETSDMVDWYGANDGRWACSEEIGVPGIDSGNNDASERLLR